MILFLTIVSGLAWTVVYADAIRIGFKDRSYAIPAAHACHGMPERVGGHK